MSEVVAREKIIGRGLIGPLRRIRGKDFVQGTGEALIRSSMLQILLTKPGELPWKPRFGAEIDVFRHKNMSDGMLDDLRDMVLEALSTWEPRISSINCRADAYGSRIRVLVQWAVSTQAAPGSNTLLGPAVTEVDL